MEGSGQQPQRNTGDDDVWAELGIEEISAVITTLHEFYHDESEFGARRLFVDFFHDKDHLFADDFDTPGQEQSLPQY